MKANIGAIAGVALLVLAVLAGVWLLPENVLPARYLGTDCRRINLVGPDGPIAGAEDIALSGDRRTLYVSAYDRLAVEEAVELGAQPPEGGLYAVRVNDLDRIGDVPATPAINPLRVPGGLRPHGIDTGTLGIAMINRAFSRSGVSSTDLVLLEPVPGEGDGSLRIVRRVELSALCAANDVTLSDGDAYVTLDRGTCPGWSLDERLGISHRGQLIRIALLGDTPVSSQINGLAFPNGVAFVQAGAHRGAVVAETRRGRLLFVGSEQAFEIPLPGGPDNLSVDREGLLIAAVHPNLTKLALYRYGFTDLAASRIVRVNPINGEIEVLFDDPSGEIFSGATSAVMAGETLVAGSVRDQGLLICRFGLG